MAIPHDSLFKELLSTFFWEFLELFVPTLLPQLERESLVFLPQELLTDIIQGSTHEVDLLARARFRGGDAFFLVHVESQAQYEKDFAARMFGYFSRLRERHGLPVYPIALYSYPTVRRAREPDFFEVEFPDLRVLEFRFRTIELNRLNWRDYLQTNNVVASALMTRMRIARPDRPRVKAQCLRMLSGLGLDKARERLVSGFVDTYLELSEKENAELMQELDLLNPSEREAVMEITTSWQRQGRAEGLSEGLTEGLNQGRLETLVLVLQGRFGASSAGLAQRLASATPEQLRELASRLGTAPLCELEKLL